jgi:hypothetical protein
MTDIIGPPNPPCYECGAPSTHSAEGPGGEVRPLCSHCGNRYVGEMPWITSIQPHGYVPWSREEAARERGAPPVPYSIRRRPAGILTPEEREALDAQTQAIADEADRRNAERTVRCIECEVYSRVSGYFRPVSGWNLGKRQEFAERRPARLRAPPSDPAELQWFYLDTYYRPRRAGRIGRKR